uniref:Uncharacterized protein n=1 Tax=Anguilla anguilla TaxID=7936 RepID=A0A0E9SYF4_ANGAN
MVQLWLAKLVALPNSTYRTLLYTHTHKCLLVVVRSIVK